MKKITMASLHKTPRFPRWSEDDVVDNMPIVRPSVCRMCQSKDDQISDLKRQLAEANQLAIAARDAIAREARKEARPAFSSCLECGFTA